MSAQLDEVLSSRARIKVLRAILKRSETNISQVIRETRLNYKTVRKHVNYLVSEGLVEEVKVGRLRLLRPNWLNPKVRRLEEFFSSF